MIRFKLSAEKTRANKKTNFPPIYLFSEMGESHWFKTFRYFSAFFAFLCFFQAFWVIWDVLFILKEQFLTLSSQEATLLATLPLVEILTGMGLWLSASWRTPMVWVAAFLQLISLRMSELGAFILVGSGVNIVAALGYGLISAITKEERRETARSSFFLWSWKY